MVNLLLTLLSVLSIAGISPARMLLFRQEQERQLQAKIVKMARLLGWLVYHTYNSQKSAAGFPDLVLVHEGQGRVIFAELKTEANKTSPDQDIWLATLRHCPGVETYLWRPHHIDEIEDILKGKIIQPVA